MIIKKISIENYLCYYGVKELELSNGLNIILGENGEGKTKLFEALDWLFNGDDSGLKLLVSAKKLDEVEINDSFRVRVLITVEQQQEKKTIAKSFLVKKTSEFECVISNYMLEGIEENKAGERSQVDGKQLLDAIFPFQIRKYSMFKGESELNIFKSDDALINLINLFSDAKHYDKYALKGEFLREKAEKAVEESTKNDKKNESLYNKLEAEIKSLENEKYKLSVHLTSAEEEIRKLEGNIQAAASHVKNAEALEIINKRIKSQEEKISNYYNAIDENYTTSLFDRNWIAVNFETIHEMFAKKVSAFSKEKRKLQSEFDRQKGLREGEKKAKAELLNKGIPLPVGVPSKDHMEEMIQDQWCKVCNREAKKGSEPYEFMLQRLEEYLTSQTPIEEEVAEDELYKNDYLNRLVNLNVAHEDSLAKLRKIRGEIRELFKFNEARRKDIEELDRQLEQEKLEREKILGNSSIAAERLSDVLKNYTAWQNDLTSKNKETLRYNTDLKELENTLRLKKEEKENIDLKSANSFFIKTRAILRDIELIFKNTKQQKFDEFIGKLQDKSNEYFQQINIDSFTGTIVFHKIEGREKTKVNIELQQDGKPFYKPNQSLLTSMHIAILFAISQLATELSEESYPMIFDAPTSSFGETKSTEFLNLIYETKNQKILLIKDFLAKDKEVNTLSIKTDFEHVRRNKAFWIRVVRPFDKYNLKTINTEVITL
jgi:DNA sulfur modification protein DndD